MNGITFIIVITFLLFVPACRTQFDNNEISLEKTTKHCSLSGLVEQLQKVEIPESSLSEKQQQIMWQDVMSDLNKQFWLFQQGRHDEDYLMAIIHAFGTQGADFDLKCLLMDPEVFLSQHYNEPAASVRSDLDQKRKLSALQLSVARLQTEDFLKNPEKLDRYYNALVWSRQYFGSPKYHWASFTYKVGGLNELFKQHDDLNYWWYARDAVLLIHATSRDDLLLNANPENMQAVFHKWYAWFTENLPYLEADCKSPVWRVQTELRKTAYPHPLKEPDFPFSDWDYSKSLPLPSVIEHMKDFTCYRPN